MRRQSRHLLRRRTPTKLCRNASLCAASSSAAAVNSAQRSALSSAMRMRNGAAAGRSPGFRAISPRRAPDQDSNARHVHGDQGILALVVLLSWSIALLVLVVPCHTLQARVLTRHPRFSPSDECLRRNGGSIFVAGHLFARREIPARIPTAAPHVAAAAERLTLLCDYEAARGLPPSAGGVPVTVCGLSELTPEDT